MIELVGIVLVVQGFGGFIHRITGSDSGSWFLQLHLLPSSVQVPVSIAMVVLGLAMATGRVVRNRGAR